jgi:hypothetical protein
MSYDGEEEIKQFARIFAIVTALIAAAAAIIAILTLVL